MDKQTRPIAMAHAPVRAERWHDVEPVLLPLAILVVLLVLAIGVGPWPLP